MSEKKILVFTVFNNESHVGCSYADLAKITMPSYEEYCKIHGYDFLIRDKNVLPGTLTGWTRFEVFLENIDKYTHIFYVECDSMLMNQTIRLENLIDDNYDMILAKTNKREVIEINFGPMLVKSSQWTKEFLTMLLNDRSYENHPMKSQQQLNDIINSQENVKQKIKIVNARFFNSQMHDWFPDDNFKPGDFICHAAGSSNDYRLKLFNYLKDYIIKTPSYIIPYKPFLNIGDENIKI